jgi:transposase
MARKNYTDEFRQRAVDLYESAPGATLKGIAADLGISRGALREWVEKHGSGTTTTGTTTSTPAPGRTESPAAKIIRLEAENARLEAERLKLETERDILRQAAKYFAGETNW